MGWYCGMAGRLVYHPMPCHAMSRLHRHALPCHAVRAVPCRACQAMLCQAFHRIAMAWHGMPRQAMHCAMPCHAMPHHDAHPCKPARQTISRSPFPPCPPSRQTREAISHARAAGCPIVVAITKCDTERANAAKVRQQLVAAGLELEEVGGNVQVRPHGFVPTNRWAPLFSSSAAPEAVFSTCTHLPHMQRACFRVCFPAIAPPSCCIAAHCTTGSLVHPLVWPQVVEVAAPTGQGLPELEEALLLQAEMMELQASSAGFSMLGVLPFLHCCALAAVRRGAAAAGGDDGAAGKRC